MVTEMSLMKSERHFPRALEWTVTHAYVVLVGQLRHFEIDKILSLTRIIFAHCYFFLPYSLQHFLDKL